MTDPLEAILQLTAKAALFPETSRYHGSDTATLKTDDGKVIGYLRRRFIPPPGAYAQFHEHTVGQGDRLDNLAAHYLGDPALSWRLCDANAAMHPVELTETTGRKLHITLPEGIPGVRNE